MSASRYDVLFNRTLLWFVLSHLQYSENPHGTLWAVSFFVAVCSAILTACSTIAGDD